MEGRDDFFAELGSRVAKRVEELIPIFAGDDLASEPMRLRDVRLRSAKKQAEEVAYQELIFSQSVVSTSEYADA
ncbi:MAG: hypothetical protein JWP75_357 [Frondihabitans sp.]|nr:hypothetical protein [Frondihabitans sp.]